MHVISLNESFSWTKSKANFSPCRVDEKHLMRFQSKNTIFKFSRRSVNLTKPERERERFKPMPVTCVPYDSWYISLTLYTKSAQALDFE